eukprot:2028856-Rhodomonas_salina.1
MPAFAHEVRLFCLRFRAETAYRPGVRRWRCGPCRSGCATSSAAQRAASSMLPQAASSETDPPPASHKRVSWGGRRCGRGGAEEGRGRMQENLCCPLLLRLRRHSDRCFPLLPARSNITSLKAAACDGGGTNLVATVQIGAQFAQHRQRCSMPERCRPMQGCPAIFVSRVHACPTLLQLLDDLCVIVHGGSVHGGEIVAICASWVCLLFYHLDQNPPISFGCCLPQLPFHQNFDLLPTVGPLSASSQSQR